LAETDHKLTFHVPPDAGPEDTLAVLNTLYHKKDVQFTSPKQLSKVAQQLYNAGAHPNDTLKLAILSGLLVAHKNNPITLTSLGERIATAHPERQVELIHYLLYTGWEEHQEGELWTYQKVCDTLWESQETRISASQLASELEASIKKHFERERRFSEANLSFSGKSVRGVTVWLEQLQPPAIRKGVFARRTTCSRELLLLGIGWVYCDVVGEPDANGTLNSADLLLTRERREALCKLCLLEPAALERMLNAVISTYPRYIGNGTMAGALGRFIRLYRMPRIEDSDLLI
jgi:hypothetical protein